MMTWDKLLSAVRIADLPDGDPDQTDDVGRTPFDRDYGRAVFCSPVRRLQDKAQVFPLDPTDAVRTRLTHSMEVSSVARGLARCVASSEEGEGRVDAQAARSIETIVATVALLHDLGNPPFGHAGEGAIRDWFIRHAGDDQIKNLSGPHRTDFENFEGNAQTIRLVSRLQILARDDGLNLTCATMSALQKYAASSDGLGELHAVKKPGFFQSEAELVAKVREHTDVPDGARNPLTLLMEAADDICFSVVDIEDGVKKAVTSWAAVEAAISTSAIGEKLASESRQYIEKHASNLSGQALEEALSQFFRVKFIAKAAEAACRRFQEIRSEIVEGRFHGELLDGTEEGELIDKCKKFARTHVYPSAETVKLELLGRRVISNLMDFFWMGAAHAGPGAPDRKIREGIATRAYGLISENYRRVFEKNWGGGLPEEYLRLQLVTDHVCGMTDGYACRLHQEIRGG